MLAAAFALTLLAAPPAIELAPVAQVDRVDAAAPRLAEAPGMFKTMVEAFKSGDIPLAIGTLALLLAMLVGAANAFMLKLTAIPDATRKKVLPWLVAAGGCLLAFGSALVAGVGWGSSILTGLVTSAAATGLWELVGKTVLKAINKKAAEPQE